jgi:cytochrome c553
MFRFLRFLAYILGLLAAFVGLVLFAVYFASSTKLEKTYAVTARAVTIPSDPAAVARGKHIAETRGCASCHGDDYAGAKVIDDPAMGKLYGSNLTRGKGSKVAEFRDDDWVRAIRHGVTRAGRGLVLMPSAEYAHLSDGDLGDVIAFLKTVSPVDRESVPVAPGPIARALLLAGKLKLAADEIDHGQVQPAVVAPAVTLEYGRYLSVGCTGCHGTNFAGGKIEIGPPDWPHAANLTPHESGHLAKWSEEDFLRTLRTAKRPDGTELNPVMPRAFANLNDVELKALWMYFKTLPPVATGTR